MIRKLHNEPVTARSFQPTAVHPLTDFKRNTTEFRERLKSTGRPEVLTVDGRADLVVLDVQAYQKLMDELERLETIDAIRQGLLDIEKGRTMSVAEAEAELNARFNLPPRKK